VSLTYYSDFYPIGVGSPGTTVPTPVPSLIIQPEIIFTCDSGGTLLSGQVPLVSSAVRKAGPTDVSAYTTWSTATINTSTGDITITAVSSSGSILVESTYKGIILRASISITKSTQVSGGTGIVSSTTTIPSTSSSSYTGYTPIVLTQTAGTSGINLKAIFNYDVSTSTVGSYDLNVKGQYRATGSSTWIDIATEEAAGVYCTIDSYSDTGYL
jgi:hypothetical protein